MKNNWQTKKLSEVIVDIKDGGTPSRQRPEYFGGDICWCIVRDIKPRIYDTSEKLTQIGLDNCSAKVWPIDSVIISLGATIGQIGIAKIPTATKQGISGIVVNKKLITPEFLVYILNDKKEFIQRIASGVTIREVRPTKLKELLTFLLPPISEQEQIVTILDKVFAAIVQAKENAERNLQNARELFESYFQSVFANPDDTWEERRLGDSSVIEIIDGDRGKNYPKKSDFSYEGFCLFMNTKNVRPDGFNFETTMFITEKKDKALGSGKIRKNDIVMTTRGTIGNLGIFNDGVEYRNIRINSGMLIFRPNLKVLIPEYLFEILRSGIIKEQIKKHVSGAAQPQLPIKTLVNFTFPIPKSLSKQHSIISKLDVLFAETKKLEAIYQQKLDDLEELKKSILQKAFNGELFGAH